MMRNSLVVAGFGAILALGLVEYGCSSSDNGGGSGGGTGTGGATSGGQGGATAGGTGGSTAGGAGGARTGGTGGATAGGAGGSTAGGTGGSTAVGTGGATGGGIAICAAPQPADKATCTPGTASCTKNCGANISAISGVRAQKPCACVTSPATGLPAWDCSNSGVCTYPTGLDATCFHLPTPLPACPADPAGGTSMLIRPNTTLCTNTAGAMCGGQVCGSTTVASYQDGSMAPKIGYCSCIVGKWQCASVAEWPTL
jgi:hypothetical protein